MAVRSVVLLLATALYVAPALGEDTRDVEVARLSSPPQSEAADVAGLALPSLPDIGEARAEAFAALRGSDADAAKSSPIESAPANPALALIAPPTRLQENSVEPEFVLPPLPEVALSLDAPAPAMAEAPVELDLPRLPEVRVAIATAPMVQPLDEERFKVALEAARVRLKLKPGTVEAVLVAYAANGFASLWLGPEGAPMTKAAALRRVLEGAEADGLDPRRLLAAIPDAQVAEGREATEVGLSLAAVLYAQDARGGRIEPSRLSPLLTPKLHLPDVSVLVGRLITADADIGGVLASYQPPHAGYRALRDKLTTLRKAMEAPETTASTLSPEETALRALPRGFMDGGLISPGVIDARVPALRVRLKLPAADNQRYDEALVGAVKGFQRANGLAANGRITPRTRAVLEDLAAPLSLAERKTDPKVMIGTLIANMERWRWLPPELGATHVFVNIPEFRLDMVSDGRSVFNTRVIVGKPDTQTPVFSDEMGFLIVNPSWFVPPSIMKNEFLPRLAADPDYAAKKGYEVIRRGNAVSVRQPPGERNALGHIKFMFPNQHSVYLHDTPGRHLFGAQARAFSHGCVRVEGPFRLAEQILLAKQGFTEKALRAMVGHGERMIRLNEKIPVHLTYFTVSVDQSGETISRADLYGHDARLRKALAL